MRTNLFTHNKGSFASLCVHGFFLVIIIIDGGWAERPKVCFCSIFQIALIFALHTSSHWRDATFNNCNYSTVVGLILKTFERVENVSKYLTHEIIISI